ncbi:MAG: 3-oxoacyl-ACP synthase [Akkermansiaceae bacterium]|nr:3-oxoacyl-ACP synthase [Akkermansiaceae bacterium]NNM30816.1 3-oxoacyl-ACP synthase [Akkermansiaceae bacterium]
MAKQPEIVITGAGAVCGAGATVEGIWQKVREGQTALRPIEQWDPANWPVKLAAEVAENNRTLVPDRKLHKSISRTDMFGLYAADHAVEESGLLEHRAGLPDGEVAAFNDRSGIIAGSGGGTFASNYDYLPLIAEVEGKLPEFGRELSNMVTPMWLLKNLPNNVLCHVGIKHQFKGTNACITNQCAGGSLAISESAEMIRAGEADRMVAIGHDTSLEPESVYYYHRCGLMSEDGLRPFDKDRSGTLFGEGAAAVVLETRQGAEARGAKVIGEYLGSGCVSEASGILDLREDGDGVARAVDLALADAGITAGEVGMICAHGNGTPGSDATEALGIRKVFGEAIPPVTGFKWCYGHLIAASGIIDAVVALSALRDGVVPGIASLEAIDPAIAPFPVSADRRDPAGDVALVICRGFGGMNVALVIRAGSA